MSKSKKILIVILSILGLLLISVGIYVGRLYYIAKYNPMSAFGGANASTIPPEQTQTANIENTQTAKPNLQESSQLLDDIPVPSPSNETSVDDQFINQNQINILMLGWDQSPERTEKGSSLYRDEKNNFRSDVMLLLTVNFDTKQVDMISIPRDTYAEIYETKGKWKINAAFAKGGSADGDGFLYAQNTVSALLGNIPINYYVGVDMEGLKAVVDAMGGIDYDVDVEIRLNGRVLETGPQHLDGQQVLDYCRARKGISTDIGRIDRQQRILFAIFEQLKSSNQLKNFPALYRSINDMIWTNLSIEQIASLAYFAMGIDLNDINRHTLEGEYLNAYGISFYVLYQKKKNELCYELFGVKPEFLSKYDVSTVRKDAARSAARAAERRQAAAAAAAAANAASASSSAPANSATGSENSSASVSPSPGTSPQSTAPNGDNSENTPTPAPDPDPQTKDTSEPDHSAPEEAEAQNSDNDPAPESNEESAKEKNPPSSNSGENKNEKEQAPANNDSQSA